MKRLSVLFLAGLAFVFNMVNMSGLGDVYNTEEYIRVILFGASFLLLLAPERIRLPVRQSDLLLTVYLVMAFFVSSFLAGAPKEAIICLSFFLITYIFGKYPLDVRSARYIGWMLLAGSYALLLIYLELDVLKGWNPNAIAMISFFSFMCYMATVMFSLDWRERAMSVLFAAVFIYLVDQTDARSSTICAAVAMAVCVFPRQAGTLLRKKWVRWVLLHSALILAVIMVFITDTKYYAQLDSWSQELYGKPLLNGRENNWPEALEMFSQHWLLGCGHFRSNSWHNWALSLLTTYGGLGYFLWTRFVRRLMDMGLPYFRDPYIKGITAAFLLMLVQQGAELGLIGSANIHLLPYMLLGLLIGRVRRLRE